MEMTILQAVLCGVVYWLAVGNLPFVGLWSLQRPLVCGAITGLILGHPVQGAVIGATINLVYLGFMYRYDFAGLLMHAEHLEAKFGVGPHTISVPRIRPAEDIDPDDFENAINDDIFEKIVAILRIAVPYTGIIVSTRETQESRERVLKVGVSQISGASSTSVGGYAEKEKPEDNSAQFEKNDNRTLDEIIGWLMDLGHIPSFCTACYREGRTGDRFMTLVKSGQIANCCAPNALMTLKEYLEDYASDEVKAKGKVLIKQELEKIPNPVVKQKATEYIENIHEGKRDFRF